MENNANSSNQTIKTENTEYKWQKLNYFNKFKIKNYILTFVSIIALYIVLSLTFDPTDLFQLHKWNLCKHTNLYIICSES